MSKPVIETVMGQPSYLISTDKVKAALTVQAGHLGPVTFKLDKREIQPFSVAPWWNEEVSSDLPNAAGILRGDLFCMPFGLNLVPFNGERHQVHGETANDKWDFEEISENDGKTSLHVSMDVKVRTGKVDKWIILAADETNIYQKHKITGMSGPMCFGHHPMLKIPDYNDAARYSASRWIYGQVSVEPVELPENKGYSMLKTGAVFNDLTRVTTVTGEFADLTRYPRGRGFDDVVSIAADATEQIAWNAVTFPREGYMWFSVRDPKVLSSTMLWLSNGGRHYPPWNGRHINVLGVEDHTSFFHFGLNRAVKTNEFSKRGIRTFYDMDANKSLEVKHIMGLVKIPADFEIVDRIDFGSNRMTFLTPNNKSVTTKVNLNFLH